MQGSLTLVLAGLIAVGVAAPILSPLLPLPGPVAVYADAKGNNGTGNGEDPASPGNPPPNDGPGTAPGNPGNRGGTPAGN
jgi:hypothetical protein